MTPDSPRPDAIVFWHRDLPPVDADPAGDFTVEATSARVPGRLDRHGDRWDACYRQLMAHAESRLAQELSRLGGHYAHVHDETVDSRHDPATDESWLHGRFSYVLYRKPGR